MGMINRARSQASDVSKFMVDWMEHRTGIVTGMEHFLYEPVPKRGVWLYTLGSATLFLITLQFSDRYPAALLLRADDV